jgi:phosphoenolpyruvate carboxykinase (ATP)
LTYEQGTVISSAGALCAYSGKKTGRSPKDKRIVEEESSQKDIWWGPVNTGISEKVFLINRERAVDYLNTRERLYVFDGFAGWDPKYRIKVRVVASRAYHLLFMRNMLIRPTEEELENFGTPDFTIFNAGEFPANRYTTGMSSTTSVSINFKLNEMVILGSEYAGEMKKGVSIFSKIIYKDGDGK